MGVSPAAHSALRAFRHLVCDARQHARGFDIPDAIRYILHKVCAQSQTTPSLSLSPRRPPIHPSPAPRLPPLPAQCSI